MRFRLSLLVLFLLALGVVSGAQNVNVIRGTVVEEDSGKGAIQAAVMLLSPRDSTMVRGTVTDQDGKFETRAPSGDYIVRISQMGFATKFINIHKTASQEGLQLGSIVISPESLELQGATVTAAPDPVRVVEDTVIYNAAAFKVADDASLEELVRKIPGMEVSSSGAVTLHGKPITELLLNGKKYFGENVKTGLKNLQADMVENIKAYERESDYARLSGIDDGESMPVLDITVKKQFLENWRGTANAGAGTSHRYTLRGNANKIGEKAHFTVVAGSRNNAGQAGIGVTSSNQIGTGATGDATWNEAGFTFARRSDKNDISANIHFGDRQGDTRSDGRSQTVNSSSTTYGNSRGTSLSSAPNVKLNLNLESRIDKSHTLIITPKFEYSLSNRYSRSLGRSFLSDPYELVSDPGEYLGLDVRDDPFTVSRINATDNRSGVYTTRITGGLTLQGFKRSTIKRGRTISAYLTASVYGYNDDQFTDNNTRYFRISKNPDSLLVKRFYTDIDQVTGYFQGRLGWTEPLGKGFSINGNASIIYRQVNQNRSCYNIGKASRDWSVISDLSFRTQLAALPSLWQECKAADQSYNGRYQLLYGAFSINGRYVRKKANLSAGVVLKPQVSFFNWSGGTVRVDDFNAAPNLTLRYSFTKSNKISLRYSTTTNTPSVSQLMPVVNSTNPLSIRTGNPYLKAPYVHNANLSYNYSNIKKQSSFVCEVLYSGTRNAVSSSCEYDPDTGVRTYSSKNINGNWRVSGSTVLNKSFPGGRWSLTNHASAQYRNDASFLYNSKKKEDEINNTARTMVKELLEGSCRGAWYEFVAGGGLEYTDEFSNLRPEMHQTPVTWIGECSAILTFPWKMRLETDFSLLFQRGYTYSELNKNYYIWNIELSQRVLPHGTLRLGWYDVFGSQDNLSRTFTASRRAITLYNGVSSYLMLRFIYSFTPKKK